MGTKISKEPSVARHAVDLVSRVNPKYHFPSNMVALEKQIRMCFGMPFYGKTGGQVAYGYTYDDKTDTYTPESELFKLLWQARRYLYTSSLREVGNWLNFKAEKLGFEQKISHMGLQNLMVVRPPYEECLLPLEEKEKLLANICQWNQQNRQ